MAGTTFMERRIPQAEGVRTLTIVRPESTFVQTLTLGNGDAAPTDTPVATMSASKASNHSDYVGAILSGVIVLVVLLVVIWIFYRRKRSHGSRGSSRQNKPSRSNDTSESSESSGGPSEDDDSVTSEIVDEQWQPPARPMPGLPPMGRWPGPPPGHNVPPPGANMGPPGVGIGMPFGGPSPMMGRGGGPLPNFGGPPPIIPIAGSGGPPPTPQ
ncbi:hypothetical protein RRF57_003704 [Xylaria bambusicola]|uniref:Uncharacterized protein n=1 Tax=Xylaria bambusicola TaxID=326684 RepID=A0AAN7UL82_9PEZI